MQLHMNHKAQLAIGLGTLVGLAACSGGGGTSTADVQGLAGPQTVSVVAADDSEVAAGATASANLVTPGANAFAVDSDYNTDEARVWVYDPSMEPLSIINGILTDTSNTAYDEMVNYGPYNAQVTPSEDKSSSQGSESSETGQSSGANAETFDIFTVNSVRASNSSPQEVSFWVPETMGEGGEMTIFAQMVLSEGASRANPFGQFVLTFAGGETVDDLADPFMLGVLQTTDVSAGNMGFSFYEQQGDLSVAQGPGEQAHQSRINVTMSTDQTTGAAKIVQQYRGNWDGFDSGLQEETWQVAFNETHFKRQRDDGPVVTLSRDDYRTAAWRYNLYHAEGDDAGQRVELNSGFGFRLEGGEHGWIGYHGIWTPDGVTLESGDTVTEETYGEGEGAEYTVLLAPGKLIKHTKNEMDLVDIGTNTFNYWDWENQLQYLVLYDTGSFWKTATFSEETHEWVAMETPEAIVLEVGEWFGMWSDSLGGSVSFIEGNDFITYYLQQFVNGSSELFDSEGRVALYGYFECLKANLTGEEVETGDIWLTQSEDPAAPHVYRFDSTDLTLYHDAAGDDSDPQQVGLADGEAPTSGPNMWGMHGGPMVTDTSALENVWEMWDLDEFYTYETGHNTWNQYAAVTDSNSEFVAFDPPLQFLYTHSTAADRNDEATYDGVSYFLQYGGNGDLWGIPYEGADLGGEGEADRWYPVFTIADGTLMGPTGTEYVVRAIELEQTLQEAPGAAPGLDISDADDLVLPTVDDYETPDIGARPVVTDPPAVINGEVQVIL